MSWTLLGTWNAATNTPTLPTTPTLATREYYECTVAGTFLNIPFLVGDWIYASGGSYQKIDNDSDLPSAILQSTGPRLYGTGAPPSASGLPNGTVYFKYTP